MRLRLRLLLLLMLTLVIVFSLVLFARFPKRKRIRVSRMRTPASTKASETPPPPLVSYEEMSAWWNLTEGEAATVVVPPLDEAEPPMGQSIFFHETMCRDDIFDNPLRAREACAVESALRAHPDTGVYLLLSCVPNENSTVGNQSALVTGLQAEYSNLNIRWTSPLKYLSGTPLERSVRSLQTSRWPMHHLSDLLRYATLYKFGGIYLDLDVLVFQPLNTVDNYVVAESPITIAAGLMRMSGDSVGRQVAEECAQELGRTFNGQGWRDNGPGAISRVLGRRCRTKNFKRVVGKTCRGFHILSHHLLYAIDFKEWRLFFSPGGMSVVGERLNNSLGYHFWNKMSEDFAIDHKAAAPVPFLEYAKLYCPLVYSLAADQF